MLRSRIPYALALLLTGACGEERAILSVPEGWASALVSIDGAMTAYEGGGPISLELEGDAAMVAALYGEPLIELGLEGPGPVMLEGVETRRAPRPTVGALFVDQRSGSLDRVERIGVDDPRVLALRLPAITAGACGRMGRCLDVEEAMCSTSCGFRSPPDPFEVKPPAEPALPSPPRALSTACPAGWSADTADLIRCLPARSPPLVSCAIGEAQWWGATACAPVGRSCPAARWPEVLPLGRPIRWVGASPTPNGDPTYATIQDALSGAPEDVIVALAVGDHAGEVALDRSQTLIGACASGAQLLGALHLSGSATVEHLGLSAVIVAPRSTIRISAAIVRGADVRVAGDATLTEVSLRGGASLDVEAGARLFADRISLAEAGPAAIRSSGEARATHLVVRTSTLGALVALPGGSLELSRALLSGATLRARSGSRIVLSELELYAEPGDGSPRDGLHVERDADVIGERIYVSRPSRRAVLIDGARARLDGVTLEDLGSSDRAPMIAAIHGSTLTLSRSSLRGFEGIGISLSGASTASVSEVSAVARQGVAGVVGVALSEGAHLSLVAARIERISGPALHLSAAATASVSDLWLEGVGTPTEFAVVLVDRSRLFMSRARLGGYANHGIAADGRGTSLHLVDLDVESVTSVTHGLIVTSETHLLGERLRFQGPIRSMLSLNNSVTATVSDVSLLAEGPSVAEESQLLGLGFDSYAHLTRLRLSGATHSGVYVKDSEARIEDLIVSLGGSAPAAGALGIAGASRVTLERATFELSTSLAIDMTNGDLDASDLDLRFQPGPLVPNAVISASGGTMRLQRVHAVDFPAALLQANFRREDASVPGRIDVEDLAIEGGVGALHASRGEIIARHARLEGVGAPVLSVGAGGMLRADDLWVRAVAPSPVPPDFSGEAAIEVDGESSVVITDFGLATDTRLGARLVNFSALSRPTFELMDGVIEGPAIAVDLTEAVGVQPSLVRVRLVDVEQAIATR